MQFDRVGRVYPPEHELMARYDVEGIHPESIRALERSVVWYTEGKGEEDLFVHHFERLDDDPLPAGEFPSGMITVRLPASPLSYEGVIVKIRWCVRIRLFFASGRDFVSEHVFDLGDIAPAQGVVERLT
ncbi:MAG: hypothetical protein EBU81_11115 [Proteobacteria bacterium]|nr:hypothetical protein [Pseudomonadota bacterium]